MIILRIVIMGILISSLVCGCSSHYYRSGEDGMMLYLRQPNVGHVVLYTSLDGFSPRPASRNGSTWTAFMPADREFSYFYEVDGQAFVPDCRLKEKDDYGHENCVYVPGL